MILPSPESHPHNQPHSYSTDTHESFTTIYSRIYTIILCTMYRNPTCHVGLAIFNHKGFPTQWVLVVSQDELFQGRVICSTVGTTVNGWQEIWVECNRSPATFNRSATFGGVVHIDMLSVPLEMVLSEIRSVGSVMNRNNPAYTDRYVLQALKRIGDRRFGFSDLLSRERELYEAIRARIPLLLHYPHSGTTYPAVSLSQDGVRFGRI